MCMKCQAKSQIPIQAHLLAHVCRIPHSKVGILNVINQLAHVHKKPDLKPGISCQIHFLTLVYGIQHQMCGI